MALIAGIYHLDDAPIDPSLLDRMSARGVLLTRSFVRSRLLGKAGLTVRQAGLPLPVAQPLANRRGTRWIVFDGRLDNADEIEDELGPAGLPVQQGDAALVLAAYEAWGARCAARLLGDFSWAVWDAEARQLVCSRDAIGLRPFFYTHDGRRFAFASQIDQVLEVTGASLGDLNEAFVADYFVAGKSRPGVTPFCQVESLLPGHALIVDRDGLRRERYWELEDRPKIVYKSEEEYVQHFLDLFRRAVRAHLRADGPVWCDLSGGLDSSSIASVAAREIAERGVPTGRDFATLSVVFDEAAGSDERKWADFVIQKHRLTNHRVSGDRFHPFQSILEGARFWDEPSMELLSFSLHEEMARLVSAQGVKALLKGLGAEFVVLGEVLPPLHLADLLRAGRLGRLVSELKAGQELYDAPFAVLLYKFGIRPLIDRRTITVRPFGGVPGWVDPGFAKRMTLAARANRAWMPDRFQSVPDQWQYEQLGRLSSSLHAGCFHKVCDVRMPFLYRPLVELAMAIPWERKVRSGTNKHLLREAMRGILPEEVRTRRQLVTGNAGMYAGLCKEWQTVRACLENGRLAALGFVNPDKLRHDAALARHAGLQFLPGLLRPIALEAWLEARLGAAARTAPFSEFLMEVC